MKHFKTSDNREYYRKVYLKSKHWAKLKAAVLKRCPKCSWCGSTNNLDVHHKYYRNLYDVTPEDCVVFCRKHHKIVHEWREKNRRREQQSRRDRRINNAHKRREERNQKALEAMQKATPREFMFAIPRWEQKPKHTTLVKINCNEPF